MTGDLHCHTNYSDSSQPPAEVLRLAEISGVGALAITDHDHFGGYDAAKNIKTGIVLIEGIEMSSKDMRRGRLVHLLCYMPRERGPLCEIGERMIEQRQKHYSRSLDMAMELFRELTRENVERYNANCPYITKQAIISALMDCGYTDRVYGELHHRLFSRPDGLCLSEPEYPDVFDVARAARRAGAVTVLAHPGNFDSIDVMRELCEQQLLDGIERDHPRNSAADKRAIDRAIKKYGLIKTGGGDFHGRNMSAPTPIGRYVTDDENMEKLFKLSKERR